MPNKNNVPVVMYHNINLSSYPKEINRLGPDLETLKVQFNQLLGMGYETIDLDELWKWRKGQVEIPSKSIVLTFDDGYIDNWLYIHPELKKRGMKATVFINPEFVRPTNDVILLEDNKDEYSGYLSWGELLEMQTSGVWSIQSHTMTHDFLFSSPKLIDFHHPKDSYYWLHWMEYKQQKPYWMSKNWAHEIKFGRSVYTYDRALAGPCYMEDEEFRKRITRFVGQNGGELFFNNASWKSLLCDFALSLRDEFPGRMETAQEYHDRILYEVVQSKKTLEEKLGSKVNHICWPGGGYTNDCVDIALNAGYLSYTLSSKDQGSNTRNTPSEQVKRLSFVNDIGIWKKVFGDISWRFAIEGKLGKFSGNLFWSLVHNIARRIR